MITDQTNSTKIDIFVLLVSITIFTAYLLVPGNGGILALLLLIVVSIVSTLRHQLITSQLALLFILIFLLGFVSPRLQVWPIGLLIPLFMLYLIYRFLVKKAVAFSWWRIGTLKRKDVVNIVITVLLSSSALIGWVSFTNPDVSRHLDMMPEVPIWVIPIAGIAFAIINAAMEEIIFRGIMMEALDTYFGIGWISIMIQAVPFAALHYLSGFPSGILGFIMVFIYGVILGFIKQSSNGLLAPFVAHIAADMTIFGILAVLF